MFTMNIASEIESVTNNRTALDKRIMISFLSWKFKNICPDQIKQFRNRFNT